MDKLKRILVATVAGNFRFTGKYLPERQKKNWHYYQAENGDIMHFRKEHMVAVTEGECDSHG